METDFEPSFTGTRKERLWVMQSLRDFFEEELLIDVLYRVKGGKEATVYCCRAHPDTGFGLIAAKIFRPRMFRAMRNDARYKLGRGVMDSEGKAVRDRRSMRALEKRSSFGKRLDSISWCRHEYRALQELSGAGADVPRPLAVSENAILMEFVGDEVEGAPILQRVRPDPEEARSLYARILRSVEIMLQCFRVHADLSAYNVLYREGDIRIIDLPQCVDAIRHPEAFSLFRRDIDRISAYFEKRGVGTEPGALAYRMWADWIG